MGGAGGGWVASLGGREELRERQQEGKRKWSSGGRGRRRAGEEVSRSSARSRELCPCREFSELSLGQAGTQPPGPLGGSANGDGTCVSGTFFFFFFPSCSSPPREASRPEDLYSPYQRTTPHLPPEPAPTLPPCPRGPQAPFFCGRERGGDLLYQTVGSRRAVTLRWVPHKGQLVNQGRYSSTHSRFYR